MWKRRIKISTRKGLRVLEIIIPGEPIAKKRPRFARRGKFVTTYNDQQTEEGKFISQVLHQINGHTPFTGPLTVNIFCYRSRPKSHYGTGRNAKKIKPSAPKWPITKPDKDNYEKFILDCLNEIVFKDDAQVCDGRTIKAYAEQPKTIIQISEL